MTAPQPRLRCVLSDCGAWVEMTGAAWSGRIAVTSLDAWRRFYRDLAGGYLFPGRKAKADPARLAAIYGPTADALDRVAAELRAGEARE